MYGRMGGTTMLSVPGVRVIVAHLLALIGLYPVGYHGLATGVTSASAAANTTALVTLAATVATNGGGVIFLPSGTYPLNATSLDHDAGSSASITLLGSYGATALLFFGAAGPFLDLGDGSDHALHRCGIRNLSIFHGEAVTSGSTIRVGANCTQVEIDHVDFLDGGNGLPLICVEVVSGVTIRGSKLLCQNDAAGRNIRVTETTNSVVFVFESDLSGTHGVTTAIEFAGSGLNDGSMIADTYIKDHAVGIKSSSNTGDVANLKVSDCVIDVVDIGVAFQPVTGSAYSSLDFDNVWISADDKGFMFNESNSGTVDDLAIHGGRITDVETCGIEVLDGITDVLIQGVRIHGTAIAGAAEAGIVIGDGATSPTNVVVANSIVKVASTAVASIQINSNVAVVGVFGNLSRGVDIDFGGSTSAARCYEAVNNPFSA